MHLSSVRERLEQGMRLFHAGHRVRAIASLNAVLKSPCPIPSFRMAAAALLAETYRGLAEFTSAEQHYTLAIAESEAIPGAERFRNEWYLHYRPRAALGLIMVLRRSLSPQHDRIRDELRALRDRFAAYPMADLSAQLNAVEGLYYRQRVTT